MGKNRHVHKTDSGYSIEPERLWSLIERGTAAMLVHQRDQPDLASAYRMSWEQVRIRRQFEETAKLVV